MTKDLIHLLTLTTTITTTVTTTITTTTTTTLNKAIGAIIGRKNIPGRTRPNATTADAPLTAAPSSYPPGHDYYHHNSRNSSNRSSNNNSNSNSNNHPSHALTVQGVTDIIYGGGSRLAGTNNPHGSTPFGGSSSSSAGIEGALNMDSATAAATISHANPSLSTSAAHNTDGRYTSYTASTTEVTTGTAPTTPTGTTLPSFKTPSTHSQGQKHHYSHSQHHPHSTINTTDTTNTTATANANTTTTTTVSDDPSSDSHLNESLKSREYELRLIQHDHFFVESNSTHNDPSRRSTGSLYRQAPAPSLADASISIYGPLSSPMVTGMKPPRKSMPPSFVQLTRRIDVRRITNRVIAAGLPCQLPSSIPLHKNNISDLSQFLDTRYPGRYMIWNLAGDTSHGSYNTERFQNRVIAFPLSKAFHLNIKSILDFCRSVHAWLSLDPENVAVVHCTNGIGRTGLAISSYLRFSEIIPDVKEAFGYFAYRRMSGNMTWATVSLVRYVDYINHVMNLGGCLPHPYPIRLHHIAINGIPNFDGNGSSHPGIEVYECGNLRFSTSSSSHARTLSSMDSQPPVKLLVRRTLNKVVFCAPAGTSLILQQDIQLRIFHNTNASSDSSDTPSSATRLPMVTMVSFSFNSGLMPSNGIIRVGINDLDISRHDIAENRFPPDFTLDVVITEMDNRHDADTLPRRISSTIDGSFRLSYSRSLDTSLLKCLSRLVCYHVTKVNKSYMHMLEVKGYHRVLACFVLQHTGNDLEKSKELAKKMCQGNAMLRRTTLPESFNIKQNPRTSSMQRNVLAPRTRLRSITSITSQPTSLPTPLSIVQPNPYSNPYTQSALSTADLASSASSAEMSRYSPFPNPKLDTASFHLNSPNSPPFPSPLSSYMQNRNDMLATTRGSPPVSMGESESISNSDTFTVTTGRSSVSSDASLHRAAASARRLELLLGHSHRIAERKPSSASSTSSIDTGQFRLSSTASLRQGPELGPGGYKNLVERSNPVPIDSSDAVHKKDRGLGSSLPTSLPQTTHSPGGRGQYLGELSGSFKEDIEMMNREIETLRMTFLSSTPGAGRISSLATAVPTPATSASHLRSYGNRCDSLIHSPRAPDCVPDRVPDRAVAMDKEIGNVDPAVAIDKEIGNVDPAVSAVNVHGSLPVEFHESCMLYPSLSPLDRAYATLKAPTLADDMNQDAVKEKTNGLGQDAVKEKTNGLGQDAVKEKTNDLGQDAVEQATNGLGQDAVEQATNDLGQDAVEQATNDLGQDAEIDPLRHSGTHMHMRPVSFGEFNLKQKEGGVLCSEDEITKEESENIREIAMQRKGKSMGAVLTSSSSGMSRSGSLYKLSDDAAQRRKVGSISKGSLAWPVPLFRGHKGDKESIPMAWPAPPVRRGSDMEVSDDPPFEAVLDGMETDDTDDTELMDTLELDRTELSSGKPVDIEHAIDSATTAHIDDPLAQTDAIDEDEDDALNAESTDPSKLYRRLSRERELEMLRGTARRVIEHYDTIFKTLGDRTDEDWQRMQDLNIIACRATQSALENLPSSPFSPVPQLSVNGAAGMPQILTTPMTDGVAKPGRDFSPTTTTTTTPPPPPPPPPMSRGPPPPPPLPGMKGSIPPHLVNSSPKIRARAKLHWNEIRNGAGNTVWDEFNTISDENNRPIQLDVKRFEELFCIVPGQVKRSTSKQPVMMQRVQFATFLNIRRSNNIAIGLSRFTRRGMTTEDIFQAIRNMDQDQLSSDDLITIQALLPTPEEVLLSQRYQKSVLMGGEKSRRLTGMSGGVGETGQSFDPPLPLAPSEAFTLGASKCRRLSHQVLAFLFKLQLPIEAAEVQEKLSHLATLSHQFRLSDNFKILLRTVLRLGNLTNYEYGSGSNGSSYRPWMGKEAKAIGFKIEGLARLCDVKSADGKWSLMTFLVEMLMNSESAHVLDIADEFEMLSVVRQYDIIGLAEQVIAMHVTATRLRELCVEDEEDGEGLDAMFTAKLKHLLDDVDAQLKLLDQQFHDFVTAWRDALLYFGEEQDEYITPSLDVEGVSQRMRGSTLENRKPPGYFYVTLDLFMRGFKNVVIDLHNRKIDERKRMIREEKAALDKQRRAIAKAEREATKALMVEAAWSATDSDGVGSNSGLARAVGVRAILTRTPSPVPLPNGDGLDDDSLPSTLKSAGSPSVADRAGEATAMFKRFSMMPMAPLCLEEIAHLDGNGPLSNDEGSPSDLSLSDLSNQPSDNMEAIGRLIPDAVMSTEILTYND
ncbi:hypothetical protein BASA50_001976 [Batrachochytrium salamandrivorans]|uniref:Uncharacterized protein n=1 Tax=Batrachochytrium salamandrivorans TaxID=1357716 RepID=A0ABQ8FMR0_9FUNG|nr:hypothetical protein BASA50_001976 [Batrachochytrium salamandrivorans]